MKKNNLTRSAFAVLLLSSTVVSADQQYPAADFQPEVIYQNNDLIAKGGSTSTAKSTPAAKASETSAHDAQYPAADFKPEVIYQNNELIAKGGSTATAKSAPAAKASEESAHDAQYPAANFKPEVLYVDPNYKPSQVSSKAGSIKAKVSTSSEKESESTVVAAAPAAEKESSSLVYLFGLVGLGLAGFYLFKKPSLKSVEKPAAPVTIQKSYALNTGVAKYINKITGTGVSRYIESNIKAASAVKATGVAKYVAKQAAEPTVAKAATGVDKYVRNRG